MHLSKAQLEKLKLIKDFKIALKDLELVVKNPAHLWNGRDMQNFSLRPREAWANWLICVVLKHMHNRDITFMEDDNNWHYRIPTDEEVIKAKEELHQQ